MLDIRFVTAKQRSLWGELRSRIRALTDRHGARAQLAREFEVTPQAVAEWLSGASAPTAETTLRLREWVSEAEAKQKKRAGSATTRPALKTRKSKSNKHEKAKSSRKK
jgi:transcriptional regulator with XRE-family HTH domain